MPDERLLLECLDAMPADRRMDYLRQLVMKGFRQERASGEGTNSIPPAQRSVTVAARLPETEPDDRTDRETGVDPPASAPPTLDSLRRLIG